MAYIPPNPNGQALMANSSPVVIASDQSALPITVATLPLPSGASTSALQTTGNTSLSSIDTKTPSLGQALAAASSPVVLTALQVTTLTPPAAITGFALEAGHLATIDTSTSRIPAQGQALAAASLPVVLTAVQVSTLTPPTNTGYSLDSTIVTTNTEIGIVTEVAPATDTASSGLNGRLQRIAQRLTSLIALLPSALGVGGGLKVDGSGTALPVSGTFWQTTQPVSLATNTPTLQSGSTTTVTQATGTNLHTVVDSGAINATLSAETTKVIGTIRLSDGSGTLINLGQSTSSGSVPVVLSTENITALTPIASGGGSTTLLTKDQTTLNSNQSLELIQLTNSDILDTLNGSTGGTYSSSRDVNVRTNLTQPDQWSTSVMSTTTLKNAVSGALAIGGDTANNVTDYGLPIKIGGLVSGISGPTTTASTGQRVNAWFSLYGSLSSFIVGSTVSSSDAQSIVGLITPVSNSVANPVATAMYANNGAAISSFDRVRTVQPLNINGGVSQTGILATGTVGQYSSSPSMQIADGNFGNVRISRNRNLNVTIADSDGSEGPGRIRLAAQEADNLERIANAIEDMRDFLYQTLK